jgi:hypothetical protein
MISQKRFILLTLSFAFSAPHVPFTTSAQVACVSYYGVSIRSSAVCRCAVVVWVGLHIALSQQHFQQLHRDRDFKSGTSTSTGGSSTGIQSGGLRDVRIM